MPKTYFCLGSYYQHEDYYLNLIAHLRHADFDDYAILVSEQRGAARKPAGFSATYNRLLTLAFSDPECEFAWLLSDDVLPVQGCLKNTQEYLASQPDVGVIFPVEAWEEPVKWPHFITMIPVTGEVVPIEEAHNKPTQVFEHLFAGFACTCIRRAAWNAVGPMDESLGKGYSEDLDWGIRCWKAGFKVVNYRSEWFKHKRGATFNRLIVDKQFDEDGPYEAARRAKERYPWLWSGEPFEDTMARLKGWYEEARR